ncbi:MAG: ArsR/SmtB family transcription factor [Rhodopirellula sp. JB053]
MAKRSSTAKPTAKKKCSTDPVKLTPDPTAEQFAKLAWAIAHPARVQIVRLLIGREACVCGEIVDCLPLAQSTVSQHLKILKESGLIQGEVDGPKVCYCINPPQLEKLKSFVKAL